MMAQTLTAKLIFLFLFFSHQDSSQIELLKELMDLQKDMVVMLLSMLEGAFACRSIHYYYYIHKAGVAQGESVIVSLKYSSVS